MGMNVEWGVRARDILANTFWAITQPGPYEGQWALSLPAGPHLFTDWRYVLVADVWGGFHWASRETGELIPMWVRDNKEYGDGPIDARMMATDVARGIRIVAQKAHKSAPFPHGAPPGQIIHDQGRLLTWFSPRQPWEKRSSRYEGSLHYAESSDGFAWEESRECVFDWSACPGVDAGGPPGVFLDPSAPDEERFKAVFTSSSTDPQYGQRRKEMLEALLRERPDDVDPTAIIVKPDSDGPIIKYARYAAVSPDGVNWKVLPEPLMIIRSDAQNVIYYDQTRQSYVWYLKSDWYAGRRAIARSETKDFRRWPLAQTMLYPGPDLHPYDDWYTNSKTTYPGAAGQHFMFPALYHHLTDTSELRMLSSPDGVAWAQVPGGAVLSPGEHGAWDGGFFTASTDLVPLPDEQVGLPYSATYYPHKYPRNKYTLSKGGGTAYALWTRERLAALEAPESGSFTTLPLVFSGRRLRLNVQTSMAGEVLVEVASSKHYGGGEQVLPGRGFADCVPISGDHLDRVVAWKGDEDLGHEPGQPLTLRFSMRAAKLFAFEFV